MVEFERGALNVVTAPKGAGKSILTGGTGMFKLVRGEQGENVIYPRLNVPQSVAEDLAKQIGLEFEDPTVRAESC